MINVKKKILFGIGNQKKNIATFFLENDNNVIAIVDNDCNKWGKKIGKSVIQSAESIMQYISDEDTIVVITVYSAYEQIKSQLLDMGWNKDRIIVAIKEIPFFTSFEYICYKSEINLYDPIPTLLNIELSGFCNCKCTYCPFHGEVNLKKGHKGLMNEKTMRAVIKQVKNIPSITTVDTTGPGEIFINTKWFELLQSLLDETNIDKVYMYTNGMLLTEENIIKISLLHAKKIVLEISIDGMNQAENDAYRIGAKYNEIKRNIYNAQKTFKNQKKEIEIVITNCYPTTLDEIEKSDYLIDSKENLIPDFLKVDFPNLPIVSQKTFFYGYDIELSGFKKVRVKWKNRENRCNNLFYRIAINYAGELLRCSCGHAGIDAIGNVFVNDILKIWKEEKQIEDARKNFICGVENSDFCKGCPGKGIGEYYILVKK